MKYFQKKISWKLLQRVYVEDEKWIVELTLVDDVSIKEWLDIYEEEDIQIGVKKLQDFLSHPFMSSFGDEDIQPFIRLAMASSQNLLHG